MRKMKLLVVVFLAVALLVPCAASAAGKVKVGDPAPAFELPLFGTDKVFSSASFKGKKGIAIAITQSACGSCRHELALMNEFVGDANVEAVTINVDARGGTEKWDGLMASIVEQEGWKMPILIDPKYSVPRQFGVRATPALIIIDKNGVVKAIEIGFVAGEDNEKFAKLIKSAAK